MHATSDEQPPCAWCGEAQSSLRTPCSNLPFTGLFEWRRILERRPALATPACQTALKSRGLLAAASARITLPPARPRRSRLTQTPLHQKTLAWVQRQRDRGHTTDELVEALCDTMIDLAFEIRTTGK